GCSKDDPATAEVSNNYLKVKVGDIEKNFSNVKARWVDGGNYLEVTGSNGGTEWVTITVLSETTRVPAGQYSLDDASEFDILSAHILTNDQGTQLNHAASRGTLASEDAFNLKINKIDNNQVEGTFSGVLVRVQGAQTLGTVTF